MHPANSRPSAAACQFRTPSSPIQRTGQTPASANQWISILERLPNRQNRRRRLCEPSKLSRRDRKLLGALSPSEAWIGFAWLAKDGGSSRSATAFSLDQLCSVRFGVSL